MEYKAGKARGSAALVIYFFCSYQIALTHFLPDFRPLPFILYASLYGDLFLTALSPQRPPTGHTNLIQ